MLNLELLQKRLDDALRQETSESLTSWIRKKREQRLYSFLGEEIYVKFLYKKFQQKF